VLPPVSAQALRLGDDVPFKTSPRAEAANPEHESGGERSSPTPV
jgi:hypothetical protein